MAVPENTGYPLRWFKQQDFVRNLYECAICLEVVKNAVQIRDCGHQFCRYCLDGILRSNEQPECPTCRNRISKEDVFSDNAAIRQIGDLSVNCPNNGCEWDGKINSLLQEHTGMCPFLLLHCSNAGCDEQVTRKDFETHLAECENRMVICQYCNRKHVFKDKALLEHWKTVCIKTIVNCNYTDFGCKYKCERQKLEEHLNQEMRHHLELSTMEISRFKVKNEKDNREIKQKYGKYIQEMKQKCDQLEKDKEKMKQKCEKYEENMEVMKQKHEKDIQEMEQKFVQYDKDKVEMKQKVNTVTYLMIIKDINKKLLEAKNSNSLGQIDSESFYSSPYGYKLKLLVYLNDTRQEYKDHMGVYLTIMKSDHDAILSWPFKKKYTFTLFDQQDDEKERENIVHTVIPRGEDSFKRPLLDKNSGCGSATFVSHETLKTCEYIKDNTVFIKLSIET